MAVSGWIPTRLGELVEIKHGWPFKSEYFYEHPPDGPIVVGVGNFRYTGGFRFEETTAKGYRDTYPKEFELSAGDILLVMTCQTAGGEILGIPAKVPNDGRLYLHNQRLGKAVVKDATRVDRDYLYWLFLWSEFNRELVTSASGTKILHTAPSRIEAFTFDLPPKDEQRAVAHILGTLDDKIELNRRMNETLEAMARALFKSWFVDFDPVRAKAEGRDPGLPKHIADLFPDSFVDSELGEIPKGWKVKNLSDLCSTQYGFTASALQAPLGPKFLRVTDINKQNWIEWSTVPHCEIDSELKSVYALKVGDLVVARMADPGKSAIIDENVDAVFASYLVRLKTDSLAHSYYIYGFLKSGAYAEYAEGAKSGSVQASMNAKVIVGASLVVPSNALMEAYLQAVLPLRRRLVANAREARALSSLRDTLLPKLISGELRMKESTRAAAAVEC